MAKSDDVIKMILRNPGMTAAMIADLNHVSRDFVYNVAMRRGISFKKRAKVAPPPTDPEDIKPIAAKLAFPVKRVFGKACGQRGTYVKLI